MTIPRYFETHQTFLDLFVDKAACDVFLDTVGIQVTKMTNLPLSTEEGRNAKGLPIPLSRLWAKQTIDTQQTREVLIKKAFSVVDAWLSQNGIKTLGSQGIGFELSRNVVAVGYELVAQIWY